MDRAINEPYPRTGPSIWTKLVSAARSLWRSWRKKDEPGPYECIDCKEIGADEPGGRCVSCEAAVW